jgi:hypothetical protein
VASAVLDVRQQVSEQLQDLSVGKIRQMSKHGTGNRATRKCCKMLGRNYDYPRRLGISKYSIFWKSEKSWLKSAKPTASFNNKINRLDLSIVKLKSTASAKGTTTARSCQTSPQALNLSLFGWLQHTQDAAVVSRFVEGRRKKEEGRFSIRTSDILRLSDSRPNEFKFWEHPMSVGYICHKLDDPTFFA